MKKVKPSGNNLKNVQVIYENPSNSAEQVSASECDDQFAADPFYLKMNRKAG